VSAICEASGADVEMVADGIGMDRRIGRNFLNAGLGYGGSCFPKDVKAFIAIAEELGVPFHLMKEVERINATQLDRFIKKLRDALWVLKDKRICVWGLTFKPDTDDVRNSVAIELVNRLVNEGAIVSAYDPKGMEKAAELHLLPSSVTLSQTPIDAAKDAEALVIATEWKEFAGQDFAAIRSVMHTPLVFDGRNHLNPRLMRQLGFTYHGVGRATE
jgi:UDPglucose 6-dehydrogenase